MSRLSATNWNALVLTALVGVSCGEDARQPSEPTARTAPAQDPGHEILDQMVAMAQSYVTGDVNVAALNGLLSKIAVALGHPLARFSERDPIGPLRVGAISSPLLGELRLSVTIQSTGERCVAVMIEEKDLPTQLQGTIAVNLRELPVDRLELLVIFEELPNGTLGGQGVHFKFVPEPLEKNSFFPPRIRIPIGLSGAIDPEGKTHWSEQFALPDVMQGSIGSRSEAIVDPAGQIPELDQAIFRRLAELL